MQMCPFARHSPFPELEAFVALFKPSTLSPNTIYPQSGLAEYLLMPEYFENVLEPSAVKNLMAERDAWFSTGKRPHSRYNVGLEAQLIHQAIQLSHSRDGPSAVRGRGRSGQRNDHVARFKDGRPEFGDQCTELSDDGLGSLAQAIERIELFTGQKKARNLEEVFSELAVTQVNAHGKRPAEEPEREVWNDDVFEANSASLGGGDTDDWVELHVDTIGEDKPGSKIGRKSDRRPFHSVTGNKSTSSGSSFASTDQESVFSIKLDMRG